MNDNNPFSFHEEPFPLEARAEQNRQLARSKVFAVNAISNARELSADQIQDMAWGLLVATRRLDDLERGASWDAS